ncbi:hypothetical protein P3S68_007866 [Capsicum galapagoense]
MWILQMMVMEEEMVLVEKIRHRAVSCSICLDAVTDNGDRSWGRLLGKSVMQSLQLCVWPQQFRAIYKREVKVDKHEVGGLGWLIRRKKGAVAIKISYKAIQMVFISCHLSAK